MSKTEKINKKLNRPLNMVLGLSDNQLDLEDVKWEESIGWVGQMSGRKYKDMRDALNMVEAYDTLTPQQKDTAKHVARVLYYDSGEKTQKPPFMVLEEKQFNLNKNQKAKLKNPFNTKAKMSGNKALVKSFRDEALLEAEKQKKRILDQAKLSLNPEDIPELESMSIEEIKKEGVPISPMVKKPKPWWMAPWYDYPQDDDVKPPIQNNNDDKGLSEDFTRQKMREAEFLYGKKS